MPTPGQYIDVECEEYSGPEGPVAAAAWYLDPVTNRYRSFTGKNRDEAERRAQQDFDSRYEVREIQEASGGLDPMPEV